MQSNLPMQIIAESEMFKEIPQAQATIAQLEAWLNFETLTANWYPDEKSNISCLVFFISETNFEQKATDLTLADWTINQAEGYMRNCTPIKQKFRALCSITEVQLKRFKENPEQLGQQLKKQLITVINDIALQQELSPLNSTW